ncbi:MAG: ferredoxin-type protein NapF [Candidatus Competibacteraceae bacterium]|nr:ferredoxin-type protein NapF [Candidatus Competibacteraceae bacterium]MCB1814662.1 ferredoxin-type protein NapF [Candidatus Competibacteraceae bacterium]
MTVDASRRAFLRGRFKPQQQEHISAAVPLRPPWALPDTDFCNACVRCEACLEACPEHILVAGDGGFPEIDFQQGECTFCQQCVAVCPQPAFLDPQQHAPWQQIAHISEQCLTGQNIVCQSCRDQCEPSAIRMRLRIGQVPVPEIDARQCTGCGACVATCPTAAIAIHPQPTPSAQPAS